MAVSRSTTDTSTPGRDWLTMTRDQFDNQHQRALFDVPAPTADDPCGTVDMLTLLAD